MNDNLFKTMFNRLRFLILAIVLGIIAAVVLTSILPKTYTVTNGIRLGKYMGVPLELPEFTKQRFKLVGFLADAYDAAGIELEISRDDYPRTVKVSIENDFNKLSNVDTLIFSSKGPTPELARQMNKALTDHLISLHGEKLQEARAIREKEIEVWRNGINVTEGKIKELEVMLDKAADERKMNDTAVFLISAKLEEQRDILFHMKQVLHNTILKNENPVESYNTEAVSEVRAPSKPSFPKLSILLVGMTILAFLGWALGCWLEYMLKQEAI